ncbi:cytidylyltransferase domain-containing protein [Capillibacterium thermochitinicola]|uniref:Glycosyltransferase family protein n=1 Tax=Capillibacterium thermochitinicola TaxID=2699427 RepID=A0A8J6LLN3_9FIRM|nr:glycosyltransferase family protein [Capillibacterium thermochitinicola]MBA2132303.1 glycosyltransferase family protein [Capillibacterium thermochitinicola]
MKKVIIVQARMGSTRLPGKVLREVLGKPLLEYQLERLARVRSSDMVVVATTDKEQDKPIVDLCRRLGVLFFRGPEEDVLARYYLAAREFGAEIVARITADCPIIDPAVVDQVFRFYLDHAGEYDYVSNARRRTYPRGMDTEVFSFHALEEAYREARREAEREHVTIFIYEHPERYRLGGVEYHQDYSRYRWTVDTEEDFQLIEKIITALYPKNPEFTLEDCLQLLAKYPEWEEINAHIKQKPVQNR